MQVNYPEGSYIRELDSINRQFFFIRLVLFYSPERKRIMNDKGLSCWGIRFYWDEVRRGVWGTRTNRQCHANSGRQVSSLRKRGGALIDTLEISPESMLPPWLISSCQWHNSWIYSNWPSARTSQLKHFITSNFGSVTLWVIDYVTFQSRCIFAPIKWNALCTPPHPCNTNARWEISEFRCSVTTNQWMEKLGKSESGCSLYCTNVNFLVLPFCSYFRCYHREKIHGTLYYFSNFEFIIILK